MEQNQEANHSRRNHRITERWPGPRGTAFPRKRRRRLVAKCQ